MRVKEVKRDSQTAVHNVSAKNEEEEKKMTKKVTHLD